MESSYSVNVYRSGTDCTAGGATAADAWGKRYVLLAEDTPAPEYDDRLNGIVYLRIERRPRYNDVIARPVYPVVSWGFGATGFAPEGARGMFGGNFIWSVDSRFRDEVSQQPIAVHDRFELGQTHS